MNLICKMCKHSSVDVLGRMSSEQCFTVAKRCVRCLTALFTFIYYHHSRSQLKTLGKMCTTSKRKTCHIRQKVNGHANKKN